MRILEPWRCSDRFLILKIMANKMTIETKLNQVVLHQKLRRVDHGEVQVSLADGLDEIDLLLNLSVQRIEHQVNIHRTNFL